MEGPSSLKRKRPDSNLTKEERILYDVVRSKTDMGIWRADLKNETKLAENMINKSLKSLLAKNLIKEVVNIHKKGKKHYMGAEFEPSKEITGGDWYVNGSLDTEFINVLKEQCRKLIYKQTVATLDGISDIIRRSGVFKVQFTKQQIEEILRNLVLDNEVMEVTSSGMGEFDSIPEGKLCYKCKSKGGTKGEVKIGAMASIPCGVCPRISQCTPDGIISPTTCVYYTKWLDF